VKRDRLVPVWLVLQATVAATVAWLVANLVHPEDQPFFAPVAAVIALTAQRGERGAKAIQLLLGVFLGIVTGEIIVALMGGGYGRLAIATFIALCIATAVGNARVAVTQAGVSAILTVIAANGEAGWQRLLDAAIGGGVALVFTQVVFSPEPVALLRRAESNTLKHIARGLAQTADLLRGTDRAGADRASKGLWTLPARLAELDRLREAGSRMARRSALWQSQRPEVARETTQADQLAFIAGASVMLARTSIDVCSTARDPLAERIGVLGAVLERLGNAPGDRSVRQQAVGDALAATRPLGAGDPSEPSLVAAFVILVILARHILIFAGLTPREADEAMRGELARAEVPAPPETPRLPFGLDHWRTERRPSGKRRGRDPDQPDGHAKD
jgi:uncharacterized membrane protein YgaE (UPF0421/DUF939 family)